MIDEKMRNAIINAKDITSEEQDGSYALVTAIVKAYADVPENVWDIADLDAIYLSIIGTWKVSFACKEKKICASNLSQTKKKELTALLHRLEERSKWLVWNHNTPDMGMFGTGFMSFGKSFPTEESKVDMRRFMRLLVDIATAAPLAEENLLARVECEMQKPIRGIRTATLSELLHCLAPCVFPVINGALGVADDGYAQIGIELDAPQDVRQYVQNVRKIKAFRDTNCTWKHYRVLDIYFIEQRNTIRETKRKEEERLIEEEQERQAAIRQAEEEWVLKLEALQKQLDTVKKVENEKCNVFEAAGMTRQEVKHSAFLAWLLDPSKPHGLGNMFLRLFLEKLIAYNTRNEDAEQNKEIIKDGLSRYEELLGDKNLIVSTERVVVNSTSRTDIFIDSPAAETVIIIENKVFTGTHDDQLNNYEDEVAAHDVYATYKKVFVYLTPQGDLPTDINGEYDRDWCVFDYRAILSIVKEIYGKTGKSKADARLKILLEDYMELVEKKILMESKELRNLCKQIVREHKDALDLLLMFTDNAEQVIAYCKKWLQDNVEGVIVLNEDGRAKLSFDYCTKAVLDYFKRYGEGELAGDGSVKCRRALGQWNGAVNGKWQLTKTPDEAWSPALQKIMQAVAPDKKRGNRYFRFDEFEVLSEEDRQAPFEDILPKLEQNLRVLAEKIRKFDGILATL